MPTQAAGVPKGRKSAALAFVRKFIANAKASGIIQKSISQTGLRGAVVASLMREVLPVH